MRIPVCIVLLSCAVLSYSQPASRDIERVMSEVNALRKRGCYCGREWMPPVRPVEWHSTLYEISRKYARYMYQNKYFSHISREGRDVGDRLDEMHYRWQKVGENIGYGFDNFYSVFGAWIDSPSHCRMLMDPDMTHMGLSKYYNYWVQSFARPMEEYAHTPFISKE